MTTNSTTNGQLGAICTIQFDTPDEALESTLENSLPVSGDHLTRILGNITGHTVTDPSFSLWQLPKVAA